jgi:hypothetical protein
MLNDRTVQGSNFTCFHGGPKEGWTQFRLEPPEVPRPAKGKPFLRKLLGSAGAGDVIDRQSRPVRAFRSCTGTDRTTRFTSSSGAEGSCSWTASQWVEGSVLR